MIAGIDIGIAKPTTVAVMNRAGKIERFLFIEGKAADVIKALPVAEYDLLAWEEPYHKHNVAITKKLSEFSGGLENLATFSGYTAFMKIRPVDWQRPLKAAFGIRRPVNMKAAAWQDLRMRYYSRIVRGMLQAGLRLSERKIVLHDQVAAALLAWHAQRNYFLKNATKT